MTRDKLYRYTSQGILETFIILSESDSGRVTLRKSGTKGLGFFGSKMHYFETQKEAGLAYLSECETALNHCQESLEKATKNLAVATAEVIRMTATLTKKQNLGRRG